MMMMMTDFGRDGIGRSFGRKRTNVLRRTTTDEGLLPMMRVLIVSVSVPVGHGSREKRRWSDAKVDERGARARIARIRRLARRERDGYARFSARARDGGKMGK